MKIGIVAGEKSGDYLGSELIKALKQTYPNAEFVGLCGELMMAQGARSLDEMDKISIMGLDGLLSSLSEILAIRKKLYQHFVENKIDVFIGIDVPDFNLTLEKKLKKQGIPTVHYASPTVWAWRSGRVKKIRRAVDLMLTLFPFEAAFYQKHDVPVSYVGHPLAEEIDTYPSQSVLRKKLLKDNEKQRILAILPGSRTGEVSRLAPIMCDAAEQLHKLYPDLAMVIPAANAKLQQLLNSIMTPEQQTYITVLEGQSRSLLSVCDCALLASGTAALEAALFAKPMVVMYKVSWLVELLVRMTRQVDHFSMPNHLTKRPVVPELIQQNAKADNVVVQVSRLLNDSSYYQAMESELATILPILHQDASQNARDAIVNLLTGKMGKLT